MRLQLLSWMCVLLKVFTARLVEANPQLVSCERLEAAHHLLQAYGLRFASASKPFVPDYQNGSFLSYPCGPQNHCTCYEVTAVFNMMKTLNRTLKKDFDPASAEGLKMTRMVEVQETCVSCNMLDKSMQEKQSAFTSSPSWPQYVKLMEFKSTALTHVPATMFQNVSNTLLGLWLSGNSLTTLSPDTSFQVYQLKELAVLSMPFNSVHIIEPNVFAALSNLWLLDLSHNQITEITSGILEGLEGLEVLKLENNALQSFPPHFGGYFNSVQRIDLSYNKDLRNVKNLQQFVMTFYKANRTFEYNTNTQFVGDLQDDLSTLLLGSELLSNISQSFAHSGKIFSVDTDPNADQIECVETILVAACNPGGPLSNHTFECDAIDLAFDATPDSCLSYFTNDVVPRALTTTMGNVFNIMTHHKDDIVNDITGMIGRVYENIDLTTTGIPITCNYEIDAYQGIKCECSELYVENGHGDCVAAHHFSLEQVVGGIVGGVFAGILLVVFVQFFLSFKRLKEKFGITEELLKENELELKEYKESWLIQEASIQLLEKVDEGTQGEVWKAQWDDMTVAVKRVKQIMLMLDDDIRNAFDKEVEFLLKCRHRNIVRFFGANVDCKIPFLVTEFMEKGSLSKFIRTNSLTWDKKFDLILDIQAGMHHIHTLGRVHRDLKSGNILLSRQLRAKIADFGSMNSLFSKAKKTMKDNVYHRNKNQDLEASAESWTVEKTMTTNVGTMEYMAPEVMHGKQYGGPADVWSFSIVLWEICSQKRPDLRYIEKFDTRSQIQALKELAKALRAGKRLPIEMADCPDDIKTIITKCWDSVPLNRPTFDDLGDMLSQIEPAVDV
eukprot:m.58889 g.58889  ORF g.58889 m.58889 type:complete len:839 (-) comp11205_c0_seq2:139-2655(-)